jgi:hypothetical protein
MRVVRGDTVPVTVPVILHRVGPGKQGPIDTVAADRAGRFAFQFRGDTTATYLLSARYAGIQYFSQAIATNPARPDTAIVLIVADTSSSAPVTVRQRMLLVSRPDESASRTVIDWFVLVNSSGLTRTSTDSLRSTWGTPIPPDAQNVELADERLSQFSPDALVIRRDSALLFAPISPGEKELLLQYRIPGALRRFEAPLTASDSIVVLLEESSARVTAPALSRTETQLLEGRTFQRWAGPGAGAVRLELAFPGPALGSGWLLAGLVSTAVLAFGLLTIVLLRRRRIEAPVLQPAALVEAAARLDAEYLGRERDVPEEEWARYVAERARIKAVLIRALARGSRRS